MAPQVKKAKTAFLYYQSEQLSLIRKQLNLSMGDAMTEVRSLGLVLLFPDGGWSLTVCLSIGLIPYPVGRSMAGPT